MHRIDFNGAVPARILGGGGGNRTVTIQVRT